MAAASTVCSACPSGRKQTGQGQNRGERGRDALPPSIPCSPHRAGCIWRGTGLPTYAGSSKSHWPCPCCQCLPSQGEGCALVWRAGGTASQSQEPVLRSCHTYFIANFMVIKLPASFSRGGHFPAWSQQDKNPNERGQGSNAQREREKPWAYVCPKHHQFGGLALGISAFSVSARLGADLGSPKAQQLGMGQVPPLCTGTKGQRGAAGSKGEQEPSALSLQSANKSLCILLPSFPF